MSMQDVADALEAGREKRRGLVQGLMDRMFIQTMKEDRVWTNDEWWRSAVQALREEVPALKLVLINALDSWRNDDWANAVIAVRDGA